MKAWLIACGLLAFPSPLVARHIIKGESGFLEEISLFDPCRYRSPNGDYELRVDPDEMFGVGGSTVRLAHRGVELWEKRIPFTFGRAAVTDDGRSCGFAHTASTLPLRTGELVVAVLGLDGEVSAQRSFPRKTSSYPHGPSTPTASALVCEPELGRFSISVLATDRSEAKEWWSFRLSDATRLDEVAPTIDTTRIAKPFREDSAKVADPPKSVTLEPLGTIELERSEPTKSLFHDLAAWDFADNGDFLTLDKTTKHAFLFRRIDRSGQVVTERAIEGFSSGKMVIDDFAKISDDAWFVAVRDGAADTTLIRRLDVRSGTVASLEQAVHLEQNGVAPRVAALTALRDSGFAALLAYHYQYTISECLGVFDEAGRSRFVIPERYEDEATLFSPMDVAQSTNGDLLVLEGIRNELKFYRSDGSYLRKLDLEKAFGQEPRYVTDLVLGANEALVVDSPSTTPLWRMTLDGANVSGIVPHSDAGRFQPNVIGHARIAPEGTIWLTDERAFFELDATGDVTRVVGALPDPDALDVVGIRLLDSAGRAFVMDSRTGCVHAFGPDGNRRYVATPDPSDEVEVSFGAQLVSDGLGGVWVRQHARLTDEAIRWVHFDGRGTRTGSVATDGDLLAARGDRIWESGQYWESSLTDRNAAGDVERTVTRMGDGRWFSRADAGAMTADDQLIVVTRGMLVSIDAEQAHSPIPIPNGGISSPRLSATPEWAIAFGESDSSVLLLRRADSTWFRWEPPEKGTNERWTFGMSTDGSELLALESPALVIHRFKLP